MKSRNKQVNLKLSASEREELNTLVLKEKDSISNLLRIALKNYYNLEGFNPSYNETASRSYQSKWRVY